MTFEIHSDITNRSMTVAARAMRRVLRRKRSTIWAIFGWTVFLLPNDLPSGAVPGIASIVYWATGLPVQYTYLGINGVLLILSLVILEWKFSSFCTERKICAAEEKPLANFEELCYTFKVPVLGSGTNPFGRHLRRDNTDPDL